MEVVVGDVGQILDGEGELLLSLEEEPAVEVCQLREHRLERERGRETEREREGGRQETTGYEPLGHRSMM